MSFIAEGGGRTVYNSSVYDARKVYEIVARMNLPEVQSVWGSGEVERTGRIVTEDRTYHVIATDETLAGTLFAKNHISTDYSLVSVKPLLVIDGEITTGHR